MTRYERETVVLFNEEEDTMEVETPNAAIQRRIESYGVFPDTTEVFEGVTFKGYRIPKKWLRIQKPRQLSREQRQLAADRARANFHGGKK